MSILYVRAMGQTEARMWLHGHHKDVADVSRAFGGRIAWISILDPGGPKTLERFRGPKLSLNFRDYEYELFEDTERGRAIVREQGPQRSDAEAIHAFVERFARHPESWALLVHCAGGVSRSGAVATWTQERYRCMSPLIFPNIHTRALSPNTTLMAMLEEVDREKREAKDRVTDDRTS